MTPVLEFTLPMFAIGAAGFAWANRRVSADIARRRWLKFATYFVIVHGVLAAARAGRAAMTLLVCAIVVVGTWELVRAVRRVTVATAFVSLLVFTVIAAAAITFAHAAAPIDVAGVYIVVAVFDGLSQTGGQLIGRRKLAPATSPGKTIEGLLVGLAGAVWAAWWFRATDGTSAWMAMRFGVAVSAASLAGDLAASWVKRRAAIKDYGRVLPGHGGVLDRFDSFLAAAAAFTVLTKLGIR